MKRWRISSENLFFLKKREASGNASLKIELIEMNSIGKCKTRLNTAEEKMSQKRRKDPAWCRKGVGQRTENAERSLSDRGTRWESLTNVWEVGIADEENEEQ